MNPEQIHLIRSSFALVAPQADTAARYFYERLFTLDPSLRPLFRTDLEEQGRKLMQMLGAAVALLDRPRELQPVLESLGRRHAGYGVQDNHYDSVGAALLWTLSTVLEEALSPEACSAWSQLYTVVATAMKAGCSATLAADTRSTPAPSLHPRSDCGPRPLPANPSSDAQQTVTR